MSRRHARIAEAHALPKLCGADIEVGNFIRNLEAPAGTGYSASRALLAEIDGYPRRSNWWSGMSYRAGEDELTPRQGDAAPGPRAGGWDPQDVGRRFFSCNGGCAYIDLDHLELCVPEVLSAYDHVAAWHAMLRIAREALKQANLRRHPEFPIEVLVNNSDGLGTSSYGSHLSFLISRSAFDNIFWRKPYYLQFLASFQVSAVPLTGQGKVGAENGRPAVPYQMSQRADFFEMLLGEQTTHTRPIVNCRDESLCGYGKIGDPRRPARLHVIFFDSALAHGSALFRVGLMQLILALIELELVDTRWILEDPLAALQVYNRDLSLRQRSRLMGGTAVTAVELQKRYLDGVMRHAARGVFDGIVPRAGEIIALWDDTLARMSRGDLESLAPRLDWVRKLAIVERFLDENPGLDWDSPEVKLLDHCYSSLGDKGLYWAYEEIGSMERLVPEERIEWIVSNPPADTRAWTRAMLLRRAGAAGVPVEFVDWDRITFRLRGPGGEPVYRTLALDNPLAFTENSTRRLFEECDTFPRLLDGLRELAVEDEARRLEPAIQ